MLYQTENKNYTNRIVLFLTILTLACFLLPGRCLAYSLCSYKMETSIWYKTSASFSPTTRENMRSAMRTWNALLPSYRRLCYSSETHTKVNYPSQDGDNLIYKTYMYKPRILAENMAFYRNGYLIESDININSDQKWTNGSMSGHYDVHTVFLHELGHTVGLYHSQYRSAVMYESISSGTVKTTLTDDDKNGVAARYDILSEED